MTDSGLEKRSSRLVHTQEAAGSNPAPAPSSWPGLNEGLGLKLNAITYPGLGLAPVKGEGEAFAYDPGAGPVPQLSRWQRWQLRLEALGDRLRYLPSRLWWAVFGSGDW